MSDDPKNALGEFVRFAQTLRGDEKSEAQSFPDHFFRALGHDGVQYPNSTNLPAHLAAASAAANPPTRSIQQSQQQQCGFRVTSFNIYETLNNKANEVT